MIECVNIVVCFGGRFVYKEVCMYVCGMNICVYVYVSNMYIGVRSEFG